MMARWGHYTGGGNKSTILFFSMKEQPEGLAILVGMRLLSLAQSTIKGWQGVPLTMLKWPTASNYYHLCC